MSSQVPQKYTLEEIAQLKKNVMGEIEVQKKAMMSTVHEIFAPLAPPANKTDSIMRSFNTGIAVFDGLMIGIKIIRNVRSLFKKPKKRRFFF